ncbi:RHS repeat protein [Rhodanobacter glycinis]|nr:RHS repeat protein [Rhodanobacter glycinis]
MKGRPYATTVAEAILQLAIEPGWHQREPSRWRHGTLTRELMNSRNALVRGMGRNTGLALLFVLGSFGVAMPALATTTVTQYTYDAGDHVASVTDPRQLVTTYAYDGLGQLWQRVSPDTGTTTYNYDGYGRLSNMTRADNTLTSYGYDGLNRITSVTAGGQTQTFTYDTCTHGLGRLCAAADATGTTSYSYSPEGWLTGRGFSISGTTYSLGYSYNSLGQIASVVYPDGNQAIYSYTQGVVSGITLNVGGTNVSGASAITYLPMNAGMSSWTSSNGVVNSLNYDTDGRLTGISAGSVQSLDFSYDAVDRIVAVTNGVDGSVSQNFGYDDESRLLSLYSGADIESYQYDLNGNRTSQVVNGTSTPSTVSPTSNQLASVGAQSYGYDAKGNTTTVAGAATYHYDAFNRMDSAGGMAYYVNPEGQRLRKSGAAGTSYFAPDRGGAMLAEYSSGGWIDYVWLNGRLIGRVAGGQRYAIHDDQTGRPEAVTDGSGAVVWRAQNFAFTQKVTNAGIVLNLGFPGQYYDVETSAWNNGFRDYKSGLGRYVESDPIGLGGGVNTYAYVGNNPLSYVDPLGLVNPDQPSPVTALENAILEGNVDQIEMLEEAAGVSDNGALSRAAANANKINHIFNDPGHKLDAVVKTCGSKGQALKQITDAAIKSFSGAADGVKTVFVVNVNGIDITVSGVGVNGLFRLGTAYIP